MILRCSSLINESFHHLLSTIKMIFKNVFFIQWKAKRFTKYLLLYSREEIKSYGFGTTWWWVHYDKIKMFELTVPLSLLQHSSHYITLHRYMKANLTGWMQMIVFFLIQKCFFCFCLLKHENDWDPLSAELQWYLLQIF